MENLQKLTTAAVEPRSLISKEGLSPHLSLSEFVSTLMQSKNRNAIANGIN